MFCQNVIGWLKGMLWDIPYPKNSYLIPRNWVVIGHDQIKIQLNATIFDLKIILMLCIDSQLPILFMPLHLICCFKIQQGARVAQWVRSLDLTGHTSLSPIRRGFAPGFVNYKEGCTRLAAASDKAYQLRAHGRWFSGFSGFLHH